MSAARKRPRASPTFCHVCGVPRDEEERAAGRVEDLVAEPDSELAIERVDQLVLTAVQVERRSFPRRGNAFERRERAAARVRHRLERRHTADGVLDGETLAGRDRERFD